MDCFTGEIKEVSKRGLVLGRVISFSAGVLLGLCTGKEGKKVASYLATAGLLGAVLMILNETYACRISIGFSGDNGEDEAFCYHDCDCCDEEDIFDDLESYEI